MKTNRKIHFYMVNAITLYRLVAAPVLAIIIFSGNLDLFKWLLPVSYFTDLIDGYLARKYHVVSKLGAVFDSVADDLTVLVSILAMYIFRREFIQEEGIFMVALLILFLIQAFSALIRYHKMSSFHTWLAKTAALLQGIFFILFFLLPEPVYPLFYLAIGVTAVQLSEEIILVFLLPQWETDVKGVYWVLNKREQNKTHGKLHESISVPLHDPFNDL